MRIRDPIHGSITVTDEEKPIIDSRFYQRLRSVRQLGFGDLAFPGALPTILRSSTIASTLARHRR